MPLNSTAANLMLDELGTVAVFASLHTASPGDAGSNEATGGSPAYARKAITWNAAASGNLDNNSNPLFDVAAGTYVALGLWSASTSGTFYGWSPLGTTGDPIPFTTTDAASSDTLESPAHGLSNTNVVMVFQSGTPSLPTGLTEGTLYYVISAATDNFQLSTSSGGSAVAITANGSGLVQKLVPETFAAQGQYQVSDVDLKINI
jgi:hypothetical protein